MQHSLVLTIPSDVYEPLVKTAEDAGNSPEALVSQWLIRAVRLAANDPVEEFIGLLHTEIADWSDKHDQYIGMALMETPDNRTSYDANASDNSKR